MTEKEFFENDKELSAAFDEQQKIYDFGRKLNRIKIAKISKIGRNLMQAALARQLEIVTERSRNQTAWRVERFWCDN